MSERRTFSPSTKVKAVLEMLTGQKQCRDLSRIQHWSAFAFQSESAVSGTG